MLKATSTPQLPFKIPQIPSNRDHKALNSGTLGGVGTWGPSDLKATDINCPLAWSPSLVWSPWSGTLDAITYFKLKSIVEVRFGFGAV